MNKRQMINEISNLFPRRIDAQNVIDKIFEIIKERLKKGEKVVISGFGTFKVVEHLPAIRRNPKTNEKVMVGPLKKVRFKPSKTFFR
ncbi:MAG: integration host factor subunit beta [Elusimicrobiales bacterium]|nr:integration host factor subunit beta [Elusimicrobiales bacterium]